MSRNSVYSLGLRPLEFSILDMRHALLSASAKSFYPLEEEKQRYPAVRRYARRRNGIRTRISSFWCMWKDSNLHAGVLQTRRLALRSHTNGSPPRIRTETLTVSKTASSASWDRGPWPGFLLLPDEDWWRGRDLNPCHWLMRPVSLTELEDLAINGIPRRIRTDVSRIESPVS